MSLTHKPEGLARPCSATDLFLVTGGLQCGNCLAHTVPEPPNRCKVPAADGPCPLQAEPGDTACWIHKALREG